MRKGGFFRCAHAEVGGFLLIPDADEEVAGFGALEGGGIDQDEAIFFIDRFDDSDEAGDLSGRRLGLAGEEIREGCNPGEDARDQGPLWLGLESGAG